MKKLLTLLLLACTAAHAQNTLTQISAIDALMAGVFDGQTSLRELAKYGDFGLGTFNSLDGEMLLLDGRFYQVTAQGEVKVAGGEMQTPFAAVTVFKADRQFRLEPGADLAQLQKQLDSFISTPNLFYAFRISGKFRTIETRSVPKQQKPYLSLADAAKQQRIFDLHEIEGTLIGLRCPPFAAGINVPGYHFHFLSKDRRFGGHVLGLTLEQGLAEAMQIDSLSMLLPSDADFQRADLTRDRKMELRKVEQH